MCMEDIEIISELAKYEKIPIPQMSLQTLKDILFKQFKQNKACDIYMLTVEHLRYAGDECMNMLLDIINQIINDIHCLSSPQLNTALASVIYKMKNKSIYHHKLWCLVRVLPIFVRIFDEYLRPVFCSITKPIQNPNQYGFTSGISYFMAALQRHETEFFLLT